MFVCQELVSGSVELVRLLTAYRHAETLYQEWRGRTEAGVEAAQGRPVESGQDVQDKVDQIKVCVKLQA